MADTKEVVESSGATTVMEQEDFIRIQDSVANAECTIHVERGTFYSDAIQLESKTVLIPFVTPKTRMVSFKTVMGETANEEITKKVDGHLLESGLRASSLSDNGDETFSHAVDDKKSEIQEMELVTTSVDIGVTETVVKQVRHVSVVESSFVSTTTVMVSESEPGKSDVDANVCIEADKEQEDARTDISIEKADNNIVDTKRSDDTTEKAESGVNTVETEGKSEAESKLDFIEETVVAMVHTESEMSVKTNFSEDIQEQETAMVITKQHAMTNEELENVIGILVNSRENVTSSKSRETTYDSNNNDDPEPLHAVVAAKQTDNVPDYDSDSSIEDLLVNTGSETEDHTEGLEGDDNEGEEIYYDCNDVDDGVTFESTEHLIHEVVIETESADIVSTTTVRDANTLKVDAGSIMVEQNTRKEEDTKDAVVDRTDVVKEEVISVLANESQSESTVATKNENYQPSDEKLNEGVGKEHDVCHLPEADKDLAIERALDEMLSGGSNARVDRRTTTSSTTHSQEVITIKYTEITHNVVMNTSEDGITDDVESESVQGAVDTQNASLTEKLQEDINNMAAHGIESSTESLDEDDDGDIDRESHEHFESEINNNVENMLEEKDPLIEDGDETSKTAETEVNKGLEVGKEGTAIKDGIEESNAGKDLDLPKGIDNTENEKRHEENEPEVDGEDGFQTYDDDDTHGNFPVHRHNAIRVKDSRKITELKTNPYFEIKLQEYLANKKNRGTYKKVETPDEERTNKNEKETDIKVEEGVIGQYGRCDSIENLDDTTQEQIIISENTVIDKSDVQFTEQCMKLDERSIDEKTVIDKSDVMFTEPCSKLDESTDIDENTVIDKSEVQFTEPCTMLDESTDTDEKPIDENTVIDKSDVMFTEPCSKLDESTDIDEEPFEESEEPKVVNDRSGRYTLETDIDLYYSAEEKRISHAIEVARHNEINETMVIEQAQYEELNEPVMANYAVEKCDQEVIESEIVTRNISQETYTNQAIERKVYIDNGTTESDTIENQRRKYETEAMHQTNVEINIISKTEQVEKQVERMEHESSNNGQLNSIDFTTLVDQRNATNDAKNELRTTENSTTKIEVNTTEIELNNRENEANQPTTKIEVTKLNTDNEFDDQEKEPNQHTTKIEVTMAEVELNLKEKEANQNITVVANGKDGSSEMDISNVEMRKKYTKDGVESDTAEIDYLKTLERESKTQLLTVKEETKKEHFKSIENLFAKDTWNTLDISVKDGTGNEQVDYRQINGESETEGKENYVRNTENSIGNNSISTTETTITTTETNETVTVTYRKRDVRRKLELQVDTDLAMGRVKGEGGSTRNSKVIGSSILDSDCGLSLLQELIGGSDMSMQVGIGVCCRCGEGFGQHQQIVNSNGEVWHPQCFVCAQCFQPFPEGVFYEFEGRKYCEHDFHVLFAPCCGKCGEFIVGRVIKALNNSWHPDCFRCQLCAGPLADSGFVKNAGRALCRECNAKEKARGLGKYVCHKCHSIIEEGHIKYKGEAFHPYHFNCKSCSIELNADAREVNGELYCLRCHDKMGIPICGACRRPIEERVVHALGKAWHVEHFVCAKCEKPFFGTRHYEKKGLAYCEIHYHQLFGNICFTCNSVISGDVFHAFNKAWHVNHFACSICDRKMSQKTKFFEFDLKPVCKFCYEKFPGELKKRLKKAYDEQNKK